MDGTRRIEQRWPLIGRGEELSFLRSRRHVSARSVIVSGVAGVGKSRLVAEAIEECRRRRGLSTMHVRVTAGLASLPFGGLRVALDMATAQLGDDLAALTTAVRQGLDAARGTGALLVAVDDAHLLDEASAALLHELVASGEVILLATARSGLPAPPAFTALWKEGLVDRLELQALSRPEMAALLESVLGPVVSDSTIERMWLTTEGNPLYLREVIFASLETGALSLVGEEWRWRGSWAKTDRLQEIVAERVGRLEAAETAAIEALAVGGPLPVDLVVELASADAVTNLESRHLIEISAEPGSSRPEVSISHPVHVEVVRSALPTLVVRAICRNLVDGMRRLGMEGARDQIRVARWSLDAGVPVDPVSLRRASDATLWHIGEALGARIEQILSGQLVAPSAPILSGPDPETAVRLAASAWEAGGGVEAGAALAVALAWTGATSEAEAVLARLRRETTDTDDKLRVAIALADVRFWGQRRVADAIETLARAHAEAPDQADRALRAEVLEDWAGIELHVGRPAAAVELANQAASCLGVELGSSPAAPPAAAGLAMIGRCGEALDLIDRALPSAVADRTRPLAAAQLLLARIGALTRSGRLEEAHQLAETCRRIALDIDSLDGTAVYEMAAGEALLQQGRPASAARRLRDAAGLLGERDVLGYLPWALSGLARARAALSDEAGAATMLAEAERASVMPRYFDARLYLARSAVHALFGRTDKAVAAARAGADWCATAGLVVDEALAVDAWLRLELCEAAVTRLSALAARTDSDLVAALARHGEARRRRDPDALLGVADTFGDLTAWLMAAEAAASAARVLAARHQERAAQDAVRRAQAFFAHCEGARSPMLERLMATPLLTVRELEVARLGALGHSRHAIADRLGVSIRTVDAHLHRTYAKLGVSGRGELASALAKLASGP